MEKCPGHPFLNFLGPPLRYYNSLQHHYEQTARLRRNLQFSLQFLFQNSVAKNKTNKDAKTVHVIDLPAIEELVMMVNGQTHLMKFN